MYTEGRGEGGGGSNANDTLVRHESTHDLSHANAVQSTSVFQQILYLIMCTLHKFHLITENTIMCQYALLM